jgi:hypothetical protein
MRWTGTARESSKLSEKNSSSPVSHEPVKQA